MAANADTRKAAAARCDHWLGEAAKAIASSEAARDAGDRELSYRLAELAQACTNLAHHYLNASRA